MYISQKANAEIISHVQMGMCSVSLCVWWNIDFCERNQNYFACGEVDCLDSMTDKFLGCKVLSYMNIESEGQCLYQNISKHLQDESWLCSAQVFLEMFLIWFLSDFQVNQKEQAHFLNCVFPFLFVIYCYRMTGCDGVSNIAAFINLTRNYTTSP